MSKTLYYDSDRFELGCATIGGMNTGEPPSLERTIELVRTALDLGIVRFDTAPLYGNLSAEQLLGDALDHLGADRDRVHINTKVGRVIVPKIGKFVSNQPPMWTLAKPYSLGVETWDFSYLGILSGFFGSMTRLGAETLSVTIHDPGDAVREVPGMRYSDFDGAVRALLDLKREGFALSIGLGCKSVEEILQMVESYKNVFDFVEATTYNLMIHSDTLNDLLPLCKEQKIELRIAGPFSSGILAGGDPREEHASGRQVTCNYRMATSGEINRAGKMLDVANKFGERHLRRVAIWFVYFNRNVHRIVLGANNGTQLRETIAYLSEPPPKEIWVAFRDEGLIDNKAPTD